MSLSDQGDSDAPKPHRSARWTAPISNSQLRAAAWILIACYLVGLAISAALRSQSDFVIYRNAGIHAAHGAPIYDFRDPSPFQYAPAYAAAFIPFGFLPLLPAQLLWFLASTALALPAMILGAHRLLFGRGFELRGELIIVPVLLCAQFIQANFDHGQINLLLISMIVWGLVFANESRTMAAGALLAASILVKPFALPVILYLLGCWRVWFIISLLFFALALLWLPSVFLGSEYAFHQTTEYIRSLTTRVPHLSHDLYDKYNQSAAAVAVRLFAKQNGRGLFSTDAAATAGFSFQLALSAGVIVWLVLRRIALTLDDARLSLSALFCIMVPFSPVSWLEYYMALMVPYMALTSIACSGAQSDRAHARAAQFVLAGAFVLNLGTRLFEPLLYCGAEYFGSLAVLAAIVALTGAKRRSTAEDRERAGFAAAAI